MVRPAVVGGALLALFGQACAEQGAPPDADADLDASSLPDDAGSASAADAEPSPPDMAALVHSALWSAVAAGDDPFAPPVPTRCPAGSFGEEPLGGELVFYVNTALCPAITVSQPTRADVRAGDTLQVRLFHFPLTAPEPATAQLVLRLGEDEVLREEIPIPSGQAELTREWVADTDYERGTPIWFHVQNHGTNEYVLIGVERLR